MLSASPERNITEGPHNTRAKLLISQRGKDDWRRCQVDIGRIKRNLGKAKQHRQDNVLDDGKSHAHQLPKGAQARNEWWRWYHLGPENEAHHQKGQVFTPVMDGIIGERQIIERGPVPHPDAHDEQRTGDNGVAQPLHHPRKTRFTFGFAAALASLRIQPGNPSHSGWSGAAATSSGAITTSKSRCWIMCTQNS